MDAQAKINGGVKIFQREILNSHRVMRAVAVKRAFLVRGEQPPAALSEDDVDKLAPKVTDLDLLRMFYDPKFSACVLARPVGP
jgi:hypothetical protein